MTIASELQGPVYVDASALVKLYLAEPESNALEARLRGRTDLLVSDLAVTEIVSSLARRRREGGIRAEIPGRLHQQVLAHLDGGVYVRLQILPSVHREAERLLLALHETPLRATDALHLGLAVAAEARTMLTYDARLARAAQAIGLVSAP